MKWMWTCSLMSKTSFTQMWNLVSSPVIENVNTNVLKQTHHQQQLINKYCIDVAYKFVHQFNFENNWHSKCRAFLNAEGGRLSVLQESHHTWYCWPTYDRPHPPSYSIQLPRPRLRSSRDLQSALTSASVWGISSYTSFRPDRRRFGDVRSVSDNLVVSHWNM